MNEERKQRIYTALATLIVTLLVFLMGAGWKLVLIRNDAQNITSLVFWSICGVVMIAVYMANVWDGWK